MAHLKDEVIHPIPAHRAVYNQLLAEYRTLHDPLGRDNDMMKRLKRIRNQARGAECEIPHV